MFVAHSRCTKDTPIKITSSMAGLEISCKASFIMYLMLTYREHSQPFKQVNSGNFNVAVADGDCFIQTNWFSFTECYLDVLAKVSNVDQYNPFTGQAMLRLVDGPAITF